MKLKVLLLPNHVMRDAYMPTFTSDSLTSNKTCYFFHTHNIRVSSELRVPSLFSAKNSFEPIRESGLNHFFEPISVFSRAHAPKSLLNPFQYFAQTQELSRRERYNAQPFNTAFFLPILTIGTSLALRRSWKLVSHSSNDRLAVEVRREVISFSTLSVAPVDLLFFSVTVRFLNLV